MAKLLLKVVNVARETLSRLSAGKQMVDYIRLQIRIATHKLTRIRTISSGRVE